MTYEEDRLAGLGPDRAIHLRWVLRDIKAKRTKLSPVSPDDLQTLIGMDLVEMWDEAPLLTHEGERALDWSYLICRIAKPSRAGFARPNPRARKTRWRAYQAA